VIKGRRSRWSSILLECGSTGGEKSRLGSALGISGMRGLITKNEFASLNKSREFWEKWKESLGNTKFGIETTDQLMN
jgi:hypothetical protein